ncbi:RNase E specificity factor CsrD [Mixta gaviniae]|uniref:RNase E specificity factor CsrD n=1 Tax=Mixta gaviniae TaxID=665914 RepID=A0A2L0IBW7_9GAMM|nr:RNase E specificity factor CsrD [Mixta gaviniae]AUX92063.1 RNase E specificity factor CsrD [Mixta gaviniae]
MRLTTKLSAFVTLLITLAMVLMLVGSALSFFWLRSERVEKQVQSLMTEIDQALLTKSAAELTPWLQRTMPLMDIEQLQIREQQNVILNLSRHQHPLIDDEPNRFRRYDLPLLHQQGWTLRVELLDPANTWFRSYVGSSTLVVVLLVAAIMMLLLLPTHRWLWRQLKGMESLEARAARIIEGERRGIGRGNVNEWPPKASTAIDLLLDDLHEAREQRTRIDTLIRAFTAQDAATGLNNRLFFDNQLATLLEDQEKVGTHGVVMMIRLPDFDSLSEEWGHAPVQEYLFALVNMLSTFVMRYPGALLARYFRSDFMVLLPHRTLKEADGIAAQLVKAVDALPPTAMIDRQNMLHIGISAWRSGQTTQQVMESVEQATRHASLQGGNSWVTGEGTPSDGGRGSVKWRTLLEHTLKRGGPRLYQKPAVLRDGRVHHRELLPRIYDGEKELLAAEFMPLVQQMGLAEAYDRQLMQRILTLSACWPQETLAVPITIDSLLQPGFQRVLRDMLLQCTKSQRQRFLFELAEAEVCQHFNRLQPALRLLQGFGCRLAVNQAGLTVVSTAYITLAGVELIKLHPSLVRNIDRRTENQLFVKSLLEVCRMTPTQIFAAGVRTRDEWQTLSALGVAGGQGDFFSTSQLVNSNVKKYSQRVRV